jgi:hypothetical protein
MQQADIIVAGRSHHAKKALKRSVPSKCRINAALHSSVKI